MTRLGLRLAALGLLGIIAACGGARVDPRFSPESRLEATIESLGDDIARLQVERDSLAASTDSLRGELARLRTELQRIKEIDMKRKPRPRT